MRDEDRLSPRYITLFQLFEGNNCFEVPRFQRGFAWDEEHISDFSKDLDTLLKTRLNGSTPEHFFGSLVTVETEVAGAGRRCFEIIDGQQRMVCFNILARTILRSCQELQQEAKDQEEDDIVDLLLDRKQRFTRQYIEFTDEVNRKSVNVPKIKLSSRDQDFYSELLSGASPTPDRDSHRRLTGALGSIRQLVSSWLESLTLIDKVDRLRDIEKTLENDCSFIHIKTKRRHDAYRLFCVLNDRGLTLSAGDLLRAATLELLDKENLRNLQNRAESLWDKILEEPDKRVDKYLQWYFAARTGQRLQSNSLYDQFFMEFFKNREPVDIVEEIKSFRDAVLLCRKILEGEWPYEESNAKKWDRAGLHRLMLELQHENCMPLLLAAGTKLGEFSFARIIEYTEKFVFRYKIVCNRHISAVSSVYHAEACEIWEKGEGHGLKPIKKRLGQLLKERASAKIFKGLLEEFHYSTGKRRKYIRYLLVTLEDHWNWYLEGAVGRPKPNDKTRIIDLQNITIEHIYPQNPRPDTRNESLDKIKHRLGNLTIVDESGNRKSANKPYKEKRKYFRKSVYLLNQHLSNLDSWTVEQLERRELKLIDAADKVFQVR